MKIASSGAQFRGRMLCLCAAAIVLGGCAYRIEIQQGNYVSQDAMSQVKPGMTREQVRAILGTPLINDLFHVDRWDYVFRRSAANSTAVEARKATLYFEGEVLKRIEADVMPVEPLRGGGPRDTKN